eukprot:4578820-Alexandrium_andersonii.AAC.1
MASKRSPSGRRQSRNWRSCSGVAFCWPLHRSNGASWQTTSTAARPGHCLRSQTIAGLTRTR